ncbi:hypothetical protein [Thiothrix unzii]|jgi:hypothetical protein|uniref:Uncharacterized protein n=1 Tax=Thiothrix unzii TaxID=111769 RepID=A0A975FAB6_9GAMM|nr:hypothetical protein [Thiothrix unzii]QTR53889.1 hypothetical protein J9260_02010 [Thiothrix unzii]
MWIKDAIAYLLTFLLVYYIADYFIGNYAYGVVAISAFSLFYQKQKEKIVIAFFLRKQVGTIDDISRETGLKKEDISVHLNSLEEKGKLEILIPSPKLYKWTEERTFPEGMKSIEIKL